MISTSRILLLGASATMSLGLAAASALAQGTPEQREVCAPDALKICADTIPDVSRTTACMRAHRSELSARCQAVFEDMPAKTPTRVARSLPPTRPEVLRQPRMAHPPRRDRVAAIAPVRPMHRHVVLHDDRDTREARRVIGRLCGTNVLNADTCSFMGRMLTLAE